MCGISEWEFVFIVFIVLLFLGPKQIPKTFRYLGNLMYELRKIADEFRIAVEMEDEDLKKTEEQYAGKTTEELKDHELDKKSEDIQEKK